MKRIFRRVARVILGFLIFLVIAGGVVFLIYNEKLPEGKSGVQADALAHKMLKAVNYEAYNNTRWFEWSFAGRAHRYQWDKENGKVKVQWDDYTVDLNLNDTANSSVTSKNKELSTKESQELAITAWNYFNNDSFWLVAPFKVFERGTTRSIVQLDDGTAGLLITYASGGTTPGDSYLWKLLPNGFPESYKMWVDIIPIGGVEATWDDWKIMDSGVFLPTSHKLGPMTLFMGEVRAYN